MRDHDVVAVGVGALVALAEQFVEQRRRKAPARKTQEAEFLRVDQAAGAVVVEHEAVLRHDFLAHRVLRKREAVADQLEHERVGRQREHEHDHAAHAVGVHELLVGIGAEVPEEVAVALGLALLGAAEHGIDFVDRLVRQQRVQEHDRVADRGQVGVQVAARVAEDLRDVLALDQHGVGADAVGVVDERDDQRRDLLDAEHAADEVGATLAVEHRLEQFDRAHGFLAPAGEAARQRVGDAHRAQAGVRVRRARTCGRRGSSGRRAAGCPRPHSCGARPDA